VTKSSPPQPHTVYIKRFYVYTVSPALALARVRSDTANSRCWRAIDERLLKVTKAQLPLLRGSTTNAASRTKVGQTRCMEMGIRRGDEGAGCTKNSTNTKRQSHRFSEPLLGTTGSRSGVPLGKKSLKFTTEKLHKQYPLAHSMDCHTPGNLWKVLYVTNTH
jgi:hypothetical protein